MATSNSKAATRKSPGSSAAGASRGRSRGGKRATGTPKVKADTVASQLPPVGTAKTAAAKKKFDQGILARGEAVPAGKPLPAGATHEIVGAAADGSPILKRKRFSLT